MIGQEIGNQTRDVQYDFFPPDRNCDTKTWVVADMEYLSDTRP